MKDHRLNFRLSDWQKGFIKKRAEEANMTITDFMLDCCLGKEIINFDGVEKIESQLKRIGNNLNQLVILGRQGKVNVINLEGTQRELEKYYSELQHVLRRKK